MIGSRLKESGRACAVLVGLVLSGTVGAVAQAAPDSARVGVPGDTTRRSAGDTMRSSAPDTAGAGRAAATGVFAPAPGAAPGTGDPSSTGIAPGGAAPSVGPTPSAVSVEPNDTALARACQGLPAGTQAPGLLTVLFRAGTSDRDRAAAAKSVGGTLGGPTPYGEEYVLLPPGAGPLTVIADRLIRQDPVTQVSPAPCPPTAETETQPPSVTPVPPVGGVQDSSPAPKQSP